MKITKRQLKQMINEVTIGGVGPGFHGFRAGTQHNNINEVTPSDIYGAGPLGDLEGLVKQVLAIFAGMQPGPDRNAEIYMLIDELEELASRD